MSDKKEKTVLGGIQLIKKGWNSSEVKSAQGNLEAATEQENQAAEVYDKASEHTDEVTTELKTAKKSARKQVISGASDVAEGAFNVPAQLLRSTSNAIIKSHPLVKISLVAAIAFSVVDTPDINLDSLKNMTSVSTPSFSTSKTSHNCTNDNHGLRSQLGGFNSLSNAQALVDKSASKAPTGTFKIVCGEQGQPDYLVQTNVHCQNAILMGVAEQGSQCTTLDRQQLAQN